MCDVYGLELFFRIIGIIGGFIIFIYLINILLNWAWNINPDENSYNN